MCNGQFQYPRDETEEKWLMAACILGLCLSLVNLLLLGHNIVRIVQSKLTKWLVILFYFMAFTTVLSNAVFLVCLLWFWKVEPDSSLLIAASVTRSISHWFLVSTLILTMIKLGNAIQSVTSNNFTPNQTDYRFIAFFGIIFGSTIACSVVLVDEIQSYSITMTDVFCNFAAGQWY